jgi:formylmethanofuran:tetrahydromethanopterin formyltransferase
MENNFENFNSILDNFDDFCDAFESRAAEAFMRGDSNNGKVVRTAAEKLGGETPSVVTEIRESGTESISVGETDFSV